MRHHAAHTCNSASPHAAHATLQMRSKRNFCIDIVLICVILGIVAYIVSMVQVRRGGKAASRGAKQARP